MFKWLPALLLVCSPVFGQGFVNVVRDTAAAPAVSDCDDVAGLVAWYDAELGITQDVGVTTWADQKNSFDWTQTTDGSEPVYNSNCQNSLACIEFDGTADYLSASEMVDVSGAVTIVSVWMTPSNTTNKYPLGQADGGGNGDYWLGTPNIAGVKHSTGLGSAHHVGASAAGGTAYITIVQYDGQAGGNINVFVNGGADQCTDTDTGTAADGAIILGADRSISSYYDSKQMELCIYDTLVSGGNVASLFTALNSKWSVY